MRDLTTPDVVDRLIVAIGRRAVDPVEVFFTGGATAILYGWRASTVDAQLKLVGSADEVLRAIPAIKEDLRVNVELAAPDDFIPELPGWRERCIFIRQEGRATFFHYDPYAQALAKIERGHSQDVLDVASMIGDGLVEKTRLLELFDLIEPELFRFPAIDPPDFRRAVERVATP